MKSRWEPVGIIIIILGVLLIVKTQLWTEQESNEGTFEIGTGNAIKLTILYDNNPYDPRLETAWGFSCLVEREGQTILFDTGGDPHILLRNMERLQVDPTQIQLIVLSHAHGDHTGGLKGILEHNSNVKVYLPASFSEQFKQKVHNSGAEVVEVTDPILIDEGIATTGELGTSIIEQVLLVNTPAGLVVITGCAHPGISDIVRTAKELTNQGIYLVLGGFHLGSTSDPGVSKIIQDFKDLGVQNVGPCHCSGDRARELFSEAFTTSYIEVGVGTIIEIENN